MTNITIFKDTSPGVYRITMSTIKALPFVNSGLFILLFTPAASIVHIRSIKLIYQALSILQLTIMYVPVFHVLLDEILSEAAISKPSMSIIIINSISITLLVAKSFLDAYFIRSDFANRFNYFATARDYFQLESIFSKLGLGILIALKYQDYSDWVFVLFVIAVLIMSFVSYLKSLLFIQFEKEETDLLHTHLMGIFLSCVMTSSLTYLDPNITFVYWVIIILVATFLLTSVVKQSERLHNIHLRSATASTIKSFVVICLRKINKSRRGDKHNIHLKKWLYEHKISCMSTNCFCKHDKLFFSLRNTSTLKLQMKIASGYFAGTSFII